MNKINRHTLKVLIVTSDRKFYRAAAPLFGEIQGKRCETVWRRAERTALDAMKSCEFDVCFIDSRFEKDTGLKLLHSAILAGCRTPLVLLINEGEENLRIEAIQAGAAFCLTREKLDVPLIGKVLSYTVEHVGNLSHLRENVAKFRQLVETLPVMVYVAEAEPPYSPIYVSPAFETFGYDLDEWKESEDFWMRLIHPQDRERVLRETEAMMRAEKETDLEYRIIDKRGAVRWVHDRGRFARDEKGKLICWQGVIIDITERRRAEEESRRREKLYLTLAKNIPHTGVMLFDRDFRYTIAEVAQLEAGNLNREMIEGRTIWEAFPPEVASEWARSYRRALAGEIIDVEREENGRFFHTYVIPVRNAGGEIYAGMVLCQDITKRKLAEKALRYSEEQFKNAFENAPIGMAITSLDGRWLQVNQQLCEMLGYDKSALINRRFTTVTHPEDAQQDLNSKNLLMSGASRIFQREKRYVHKDGHIVWAFLNVSVVYDEHENPSHFISQIQDITERKLAENTLRLNEAKLKDLFDNAPTGYHELDREARIVRVNRTELEMLGYREEEILGKFAWEFVTDPIARESVLKKLSGAHPLTPIERTFRRKDGTLFPVLLKDALIEDENGTVTGLRANIQDITEQKRAEQALLTSEQKYRMLGEGIMHQVWTALPDGSFDYINARTIDYFRLPAEQIIAEWQSFIHPEDLPRCLQSWRYSLSTGEDYETEFRLRRHDGKYLWHQARATAGRDADGTIVKWFGTNTDNNNEKIAEEQLHHIAGHDTLTNLPNRTKFMNHLTRAVSRAEHNPSFRFAVLYLDLDRFKVINDSLGHNIGDKLLVAFAQKLEECLRPNDIVARLGGDEFTVLLCGIKDAAAAVSVAERILEKLSVPFKLDTYEVFTSASIGIIVSDEVPRQPEDFLRDADTAMYRAKAAGKSRYEIFDREMHIRNMNLLQMENDLRRAIERREFRVFYQPIIELDTGKVLELEALIRWQHPQHGLIAPYDFICIAEETGLIIPIGAWILEEACRQTAEWQRRFPEHERLSISVNLSAKQLLHPNIAAQVKDVLKRTQFEPRCLKLEVTETMVMENGEKSLAVINDFHRLGVAVSTDDFGTGYSSLSYLHQFPFDRLKIDRSFVGKMEKDVKSEAIVRTILLLGQNLEIETVAEGIENEHQLARLRSLGCRLGQGYYFSKPVDAASAEKLLEEGLPVIISPTEKTFSFGKSNEQRFIELDEVQ